MTSALQIEANRRNAQKSTGPKTAEGKAISRANALKHGLTGAGIVLVDDDTDAVAQRLEDWRSAYKPEGAAQEWLYTQLVVQSVRVDRCQREEATLRAYQAERASLCWDEDRQLAAEILGDGLANKSSLTVAKLRQTKQGCEWLLERWCGLGAVLARGGEWNRAQQQLALDLLGTPRLFRDRLELPETAESRSEVVNAAIAAIEARLADALNGLDAHERCLTEEGREPRPSQALAQLRRYEAACMRKLEWAREQLRPGRRIRQPAPNDQPAGTAQPDAKPGVPPAPEPAPAVAERPPFDARLIDPMPIEAAGMSPIAVSAACGALTPKAPTQPVISAPAGRRDVVQPPPRRLNRRQRRAAQRLAAQAKA
jgi:hypothetical protein